jgi:acylphosphatase
MEHIRVRVVVHGFVQGVFFRDSTRRKANSLGITGWVRNRSDGAVEILAEGTEEAMANFLAWCRKGPPSAEVSRVEEERQAWRGEFDAFDIVR